jgi:hypothetical protein
LEQPEFAAIEHGYYGRYLRRYLEHFRLDQMLVLVFEEAMSDTSQTKQRIAEFLGVDPAGFAPSAGERVVNASFLPKARRVYSLAFGLSRILRRLDLDVVVNVAKWMGVKEMFGSGGNVAPMSRETSKWLSDIYDTDIGEVEQILGMSLAIWRQDVQR